MLKMDELKIGNNNIEAIHFNSISITEDIFENDYDYTCNYDVSIKYKNIDTGDRKLNEYINNKAIKDSRRLNVTHHERPEILLTSGAITEHDIVEGKDNPEIIDAAIEDFLQINKDKKPGTIMNIIYDVFNYDIPKRIAQDVIYNSKIELDEGRKVSRVEYNYKKSSIKRVAVFYEDNDFVTVELKSEVTDKNVDNIIPGQTLASVYISQEQWFGENYEKTIEILNSIFGFDLETLKGGKVVW